LPEWPRVAFRRIGAHGLPANLLQVFERLRSEAVNLVQKLAVLQDALRIAGLERLDVGPKVGAYKKGQPSLHLSAPLH
jgi:hypothetical protein